VKPYNAQPGSIRFPLTLQLRYKAFSADMAILGTGQTKLISSTELIFTSDQPIEAGMQAEICVAWPALLDGRVRLQLILKTIIVRSAGPVAAARISKYDYRTRGPWQTELSAASGRHSAANRGSCPAVSGSTLIAFPPVVSIRHPGAGRL
jgi:hypothetical protein